LVNVISRRELFAAADMHPETKQFVARLRTAPMLMSTVAFDSVSRAGKSVETSLLTS
jgi:hypothetical protein